MTSFVAVMQERRRGKKRGRGTSEPKLSFFGFDEGRGRGKTTPKKTEKKGGGRMEVRKRF